MKIIKFLAVEMEPPIMFQAVKTEPKREPEPEEEKFERSSPSLLEVSLSHLVKNLGMPQFRKIMELRDYYVKLEVLRRVNERQDLTIDMAVIVIRELEDVQINCNRLRRNENRLITAFKHKPTLYLRALMIEECRQLNNILTKSLFKEPNTLPSLRILSFRGAEKSLSDSTLVSIGRFAPGLQSLDISACHVTSSGLNRFAEEPAIMASLRELYLIGCPRLCMRKSVEALRGIRNLEVLHVAATPGVNDWFVGEIATGLRGRLKEIGLEGSGLTDRSLESFGAFCPGLMGLDIENNKEITDRGLLNLANGCPSIQMLKLGHNTFSDEGLATLLDAYKDTLVELSLESLPKVGSKTAKSLSANTRELVSLNLLGCCKLTKKSVKNIRIECKALKELKVDKGYKLYEIWGRNVVLPPKWVSLRYSPLDPPA